jgi:hypothetical protein
MSEITLNKIVERSVQIRKLYHKLEQQYHKKKWTVEEDALAFLSDAGLVGRLTMSQQGRWPMPDKDSPELKHKLGECIWWLIVLAERMDVDIQDSLECFLSKTEEQLK